MKAYKKRMIKEYNQLNKRYKKLKRIINMHEAGTLPFETKCPDWLLQDQLNAMTRYRDALLLRAEYEDIDLEY